MSIKVKDLPKTDILYSVSNPIEAQEKAYKYLDSQAILYKSKAKNKKYSIINPTNYKIVNFGDIQYEDYTFSHNEMKRKSYLSRTVNIKGNWKSDPYSPNNLSRNILW